MTATTTERIVELKAQIADAMDQAEALTNVAQTEGRELTADEQTQFSAIMDADAGTLAKLEAKLEAAEKLDAERKRLANLRNDGAGRDGLTGARTAGADSPEIRDGVDGSRRVFPCRVGRLRNFKGADAHRNAYTAGAILLARAARSGACPKLGRRHADAEAWLTRTGFQNAMTTGGSSAGDLVPDPLSQAIIDVRYDQNLARQLCRVIPMTSDSLDVPKREGGVTVEYPGEATGATGSDKSWGTVPLSAVKRVALTKISQELREDAIIDTVDDIVSEFATAFRVAEEREFVAGDGNAGSGGVTGLLDSLGAAGKNTATGVTAWSGYDLNDFTDTMALLPSRFWAFDTAWVCSAAFYYSVMVPLMVGGGGNSIMTIEDGMRMVPAFLGKRVWFTDYMPQSFTAENVDATFGAYSQAAILGDRIGVQVAQSDQFAFDEDVTTVRGRARYDIAVHEPGDGSDAGAYVGLASPAA